MRYLIPMCAFGLLLVFAAREPRGQDPEATVRAAAEILLEQTQMPGRRVPESLLADAQGVAIIPDMLKIGFVAAVRRGRGVVLVRDEQGVWSLPQFITLTGGSVGWQAGIQGTDVVLVFRTRKSVQNLLNGKFTIGADASASAGPVGRNAAAATDGRLQSEILSYSRSRGLFAGVALDGSVIEMDTATQSLFYEAPVGQPPARIPESALRLVQELTALSSVRVAPPETELAAGQTTAAVVSEPKLVLDVRSQLIDNWSKLNSIVDQQWRAYLALPREVTANPPQLSAAQTTLAKYDKLMQSPTYQPLTSRPEFKATYESLRAFVAELSEVGQPALALPPPPISP